MDSHFSTERTHVSWQKFIQAENNFLCEIYREISDCDYTPTMENVLRFSQMPLDSIKCVILGQDPYPAKGAATGRAFEVFGLYDWCKPFAQTSLRNILRLIYKSYQGEIADWATVKDKIKTGEFNVLPPNQLFQSWTEQGVLLLNTSLTCQVGKSNSHKQIWKGFCLRLVKFIAENCPQAVWFLWGNDAISYKLCLPQNKIFSARHPMIAGTKYPDDFLNCPCFEQTKYIINWKG